MSDGNEILAARLIDVESEPPPAFGATLLGAALLLAVFGVTAQIATISPPTERKLGIGVPGAESGLPTQSQKVVAKPIKAPDINVPVAAETALPQAPAALPDNAAPQNTTVESNSAVADAQLPSASPSGPREGLRGLVCANYGAYIFTLWAMVARINGQALTGRFLIRLGLQAAASSVLGFVVGYIGAAGVIASPNQSVFLYFLLGLFPTWASRMLTTRAREIMVPDEKGDERLPLCLIDGIDSDIADRLSEVGIWDIQHIATSDPVDLLSRTQYPLDRVLDWIDQALLINYVRDDIVQFRSLGIRGAIDLAVYAPPNRVWFLNRATSAEERDAINLRFAEATELLKSLSELTHIKRPALLAQILFEDKAVDLVWRLWQRERTSV